MIREKKASLSMHGPYHLRSTAAQAVESPSTWYAVQMPQQYDRANLTTVSKFSMSYSPFHRPTSVWGDVRTSNTSACFRKYARNTSRKLSLQQCFIALASRSPPRPSPAPSSALLSPSSSSASLFGIANQVHKMTHQLLCSRADFCSLSVSGSSITGRIHPPGLRVRGYTNVVQRISGLLLQSLCILTQAFGAILERNVLRYAANWRFHVVSAPYMYHNARSPLVSIYGASCWACSSPAVQQYTPLNQSRGQ